MKIIILSLLFFLNLTFYLNANEIVCKNFDISCKTKKYVNDAKKYVNDTKEFQKKKWNETNIKKKEIKK